MWDNYRRLTVNRDHMVVIPKGDRPGPWFGAGPAIIAPLCRKRSVLIDRAKWVHAWTLYNNALDVTKWLLTPEGNSTFHLSVEIKARQPSGWHLTIPQELRRKGWLPEAGGIVIYEYTDSEANLWTEAAYNEEAILEADAS